MRVRLRACAVVSGQVPTVAAVHALPAASASDGRSPHATAGATGSQGTFDELGTPLREVTFVVVDLETTGGAPVDCGITEIGAVKVRGGEVLGEFHSLVNPGATIPPFIQVLTGITDTMVAASPPLSSVLPAFLDFARGSVLVAHNAPFDVGFLRAAAQRHGAALAGVRGARHRSAGPPGACCATRRPTAGSRRWRACSVRRTQPTHRALDDARATVDVLHGLIERVGTLGVDTLEELTTYSSRVPPQLRRKRHLADARAARTRGLPVRGRRRPGALRRAGPRTCAPGCAPTSPRARCAPAWRRWCGWPSGCARCRARPRSRPRCASCA